MNNIAKLPIQKPDSQMRYRFVISNFPESVRCLAQAQALKMNMPLADWVAKAIQNQFVEDRSGRSRRARVVVVDDDRRTRQVLSHWLTTEGYEPLTFDSPLAALAAFKSGEPADLMITDIDMSCSMSGLDLAREARRMLRNVPVVLLANNKAVRPTADVMAVVQKPFRIDDLVSAVRQCLVAR